MLVQEWQGARVPQSIPQNAIFLCFSAILIDLIVYLLFLRNYLYFSAIFRIMERK